MTNARVSSAALAASVRNGLTYTAVGDMHGISRQEVKRRIQHLPDLPPPQIGVRRVPVDMSRVAQLQSMGVPATQIAARLGIGRTTLWTRLRDQRRAA